MMMVQTVKQRSSSVEDYLKTIASLSRQKKGATVTNISKMLGVKKPSVTSALERMSREGLVVHQKYGAVKLTPQGARAARDVDHRHHILCHLLIDILKVEPSIAEEDAHLMEHALSQSSLEKLEDFVEFIMKNARKKNVSGKRMALKEEEGKRENGC
jgi:DtxR family transcriptional regulator, Mn-dependent transcriptional regulator